MRASRDAGRGATPRRGVLRRLPGRRESLPRSDSERLAAAADSADMSVEDVLRQVADFRLALETDMIIAAAAVDADTPELLSEVLDGERAELASFHDRLLSRLADAAADDELALRRSRPVAGRGRFAQVVAVAAAALAILGGTRTMTGGADSRDLANVAAMETADQHYADFSHAVNSASGTAVREAAHKLHDTLQRLINEHANDPEVAHRAAQLLQAEISLLRATDPDGASQVLAQARNLVTLLEKAVPKKVRESVQPVLDAAVSPRPARPSQTASPTPTRSPSPSPTATRSSSSSGEDSPLP